LLAQIRILNDLALNWFANDSIYLQILFQRLGFPGRLPFRIPAVLFSPAALA
jgi:hypothetical protein